MDLQVM